MNIEELLLNGKGTIIDVRDPYDFALDHLENSFNIPLSDIPDKIELLKTFKKPLIFICLIGSKSGQAVSYLSNLGFEEIYNGGGWLEIKQLLSEAI